MPKNRHDNKDKVKKEILKTFQTREELLEFEQAFIKDNDCIQNPNWYNVRIKTYDRYNTKTKSRKSSIKPSTSGKTLSKRYGNGFRTPAQLDGARRMREKLTGVKNPAKGKSGIKNSGFTPWYYITPEGVYVEVHDRTKQDMAKELGFSPRQLGHGFHYSNMHKKADKLPRKGWTFGNLPRP